MKAQTTRSLVRAACSIATLSSSRRSRRSQTMEVAKCMSYGYVHFFSRAFVRRGDGIRSKHVLIAIPCADPPSSSSGRSLRLKWMGGHRFRNAIRELSSRPKNKMRMSMSERCSQRHSASQRNVPVLASRPFHALGPQHFKRARDRPACMRGFDHVVHIPALRGNERI
jgi:hypothetical protein